MDVPSVIPIPRQWFRCGRCGTEVTFCDRGVVIVRLERKRSKVCKFCASCLEDYDGGYFLDDSQVCAALN